MAGDRVFLSYAHEDRESADRVVEVLGRFNIEVWRDVEALRAGDNWPARIGESIAEVNALVLLWSANSARSDFVEFEWSTALALKVPIIPVRVDEAILPPSLASKHAVRFIDLAGSLHAAVQDLPQINQSRRRKRKQKILHAFKTEAPKTPQEATRVARELIPVSTVAIIAVLIAFLALLAFLAYIIPEIIELSRSHSVNTGPAPAETRKLVYAIDRIPFGDSLNTVGNQIGNSLEHLDEIEVHPTTADTGSWEYFRGTILPNKPTIIVMHRNVGCEEFNGEICVDEESATHRLRDIIGEIQKKSPGTIILLYSRSFDRVAEKNGFAARMNLNLFANEYQLGSKIRIYLFPMQNNRTQVDFSKPIQDLDRAVESILKGEKWIAWGGGGHANIH